MTAAPTTVTLANGQVAHYWRRGSGSPVLYLHSLLPPDPDSPFVAGLAERFEVIMPLAPGYQDLDELRELDDGHELALFYDDLLRHLDFERIDVVGHCLGGFVALELASHFPERVGTLALVAPFGLWVASEPTADLARIPARQLRRRLLTNPPPDPESPDVEDAVALSQGMTSTLKFLWPFPERLLARRLHRISSPTRIFWGTEDELNPVGYATRLAEAIAGAAVEQLPGRHLLLEDQPELMADRLGEFLSTTGSLASPEARA